MAFGKKSLSGLLACWLMVLVACQGPRPTIRLAGGRSRCDGRVEIRTRFGEWRALCDYKWDLADASVVCHSLGCGMLHEWISGSLYGTASQTLQVSFNCRGHEQSLSQCQNSTVTNSSRCTARSQAAIRCRMPCLPGDPYGLHYRGPLTAEARQEGRLPIDSVAPSRHQLGRRRRKRTPLHCPVYRCAYPGPVENGDITGQYLPFYGVGTILLLQCKVGFYLQGSRWLHCGHSGLWSDDHPLCLPGKTISRKSSCSVILIFNYLNANAKRKLELISRYMKKCS